jgi:hypothetical protein
MSRKASRCSVCSPGIEAGGIARIQGATGIYSFATATARSWPILFARKAPVPSVSVLADGQEMGEVVK